MVRAGKPKVWAVAVAAMVVALACLGVGSARGATSVPTGLTDSLVANLGKPTSMAVAPGGRVFVTQKATNNVGKVRVIKNGSLLTKPFLKLTTDTSYARGLLGITLDPNFSTNHYVYVFYTATSPTVHNRVSRFTANGDVAASGSQKVLLDLPTLGTSGGHYGGALRFGADGKLYVGTGDDAKPRETQSLASLNGKVLRINRDGTIPSGNPFFDSASGDRRAIWALGLRQAYSLDVLSGTSQDVHKRRGRAQLGGDRRGEIGGELRVGISGNTALLRGHHRLARSFPQELRKPRLRLRARHHRQYRLRDNRRRLLRPGHGTVAVSVPGKVLLRGLLQRLDPRLGPRYRDEWRLRERAGQPGGPRSREQRRALLPLVWLEHRARLRAQDPIMANNWDDRPRRVRWGKSTLCPSSHPYSAECVEGNF
jgi:hypothetical protein